MLEDSEKRLLVRWRQAQVKDVLTDIGLGICDDPAQARSLIPGLAQLGAGFCRLPGTLRRRQQ